MFAGVFTKASQDQESDASTKPEINEAERKEQRRKDKNETRRGK